MKRKMLSLPCITLCAVLLFGGCGAKSMDSMNSTTGAVSYSAKNEASYAVASDYSDYDGGYSVYDHVEPAEDADYESVVTGNTTANADNFDKIIYSGNANVETIHFEDTIKQVYALIDSYGGFLESSYVTGKDYASTYYDSYAYRSASFVIRIPRQSFQSFTGALETLGNLTYSSIDAQNITSAYQDTESRLATYRTEEERLLSMLEKAEQVTDMLDIEDRLATVRYNIEALTTNLTNWDSKINYSTLSLSVSEVKELTPETPITYTFGEEIVQGLTRSCRWLVQALKNTAVFLISAIPILILPAVIIVILVLVIRAKKRKKREKLSINDVKVDR